jgi:hypothetical protein
MVDEFNDEPDFEENFEDDPSLREDNVYNKKSRESRVNDDEISPEEEGFMQGYEEDEE